MKYASILFLSVAVVFAVFAPVSAHRAGPDGQGNPWFMPAIPDEGIPSIDGNLDDWSWWPSRWTFTRDNFAATAGSGNWNADEANTPRDDWDAIVYGPAWVPTENKVVWAVKITDNILYAPFEPGRAYQMDGGQIAIDADHGGDPGPCGGGNGQEYQQSYWTLAEGGKIGLFEDATLLWAYQQPYDFFAINMQSNGSYEGEFMITLWDHLDPAGEGASRKHVLTEGETIGFSVELYDMDSDTEQEFPDFEFDYGSACDGGPVMPDWELLPISETLAALQEEGKSLPSAVESNSWGRIKATFTK